MLLSSSYLQTSRRIQATARGYVEHRMDLWSLGVVLHEMIHCGPPFKGANTAALLYSVVHAAREPLTNAPPALQRDVDRCLEMATEQRYATAAQFVRELEM